MKLKNFLLAVILFSVSLYSFGQSRISSNESAALLTQAVTALEETTDLLEKAKAENATLKTENAWLQSELEKEKKKKNSNLLEEIAVLEAKLKDAEDALDASNTTLVLAKQQIIADQEDIANLRARLKQAMNLIETQNTFSLGGGILYPTGGEVLFLIRIPKLPLSVFTSAGIIADPLNVVFSLGATYNF